MKEASTPAMMRKRLLAIIVIAVMLPVFAETAPQMPNASQLIGFLNQTLGWYGRLDAEAQLADQPTDVLYVNDDRQIAKQVVALSFEFARAYTPLLDSQQVSAPAAAGGTASSQRY